MRISNRERYLLLNALDSLKLLPCLKDNRAVIAGGALRSVFNDKPIKDYDLYFRMSSDADRVVQYLSVEDSGFKLIVKTENAITFKKDGVVIQVIVKDDTMKSDINSLLDMFDYTVCMAAYDISDDRLYLGEDFLKHNAQKRLVFNPKTNYPIASLVRLKKYTTYGYSVSGIELVKIALSVNKVSIRTYKELKEQLLGIDTIFLKELTDKLAEPEQSIKQYEFDEFMYMLEEFMNRYYAYTFDEGE